MVAELAKRFCYRVVLPACLFTGAFLRPSFISLIYVLVALIGPAFPSIRKNVPIAVPTRLYFLCCVALSLLLLVLQFAYQLFEVFTITEGEYEHECLDAVNYPVRFWLRQAGFIRIPQQITFSTIRLIAPELLSLLGSLVALIVCTAFQTDSGTESNWRQPQQTDDLNEGLQVNEQAPSTSSANATCPIRLQHPSALKFSTAIVPSLKRVSDVLLMLFVVVIGAIQPSILNSAYFAIFLIVLTWWALYTPLRRHTFNMIKRIFILYSALHFIAIYVYQIQVVQDAIPPKGFPARLVGLTALVSTKCTNQTLWWELQWPDYYSWTGYVNFGFLLLLYHVLVLQYVWTRNGVRGFGRSALEGGMGGPNDDNGSSVHEELYALDDIRPAVPNPLEATVGFLDIEKDIDGKVLLSNSGSEESETLNAPDQRITSEILDRQKISMIVNGPGEKTSMAAQGMQAFLYFCLYHCYVFGLLAMMTWALLYHSVFGLIFLISACFIWALRNSRKWSFALSPVILLYTEFLLVAQYIYSMDIAAELPHESFMEIIGFIFADSKTQSFVTLCVKVLLSLPIFLLLRLHLRENYYNSLTDHDRLKRLTYGTFDAITSTTYPSGRNVVQTRRPQPPRSVTHPDNAAFDFITHYFVKYWIFVVVTLLLINCPLTESRQPVLYNLGFFAFFTILIVNLHISFNFFRRTIYLFLTVLIIYTSLVLIAVYTYQFPSVNEIFQNLTGLNKNWTDDIGLVVFDNAQHDVTLLFIRLILPISLIVVTMLQLKFFHDPWTKLVKIPTAARSAPPVTPATAEAGTSAQLNTLDDTIVLAKGHMRELIEVLWRLAEVHGYRFILFVMVMVAVEHFCVLNFVIIVFVSLAACLTSLTGTISLFMCVYMSTIFIARRVYELHLSQNFDAVVVESNDTGVITDCNGTEPCHQFKSVTTWLGFSDAADLRSDLQGLVLVIVLIGLQLCVRYRQKHRRAMLGIPEPQPGIIFPDVGPSMFDKNIVSSLKCLLNYGFYKFGLEISLAAMVVVSWIRMDMVAALLTIWLLFFVFMPRAGCRVCWPIFLIYLAVMFPLQYAMAIGLPEDWNLDYPWNGLLKQKRLDNNLSYFLDLANNRMLAWRFRGYIVADFFLLAIAAAQEVIFRSESINHPAGDNSSIYKDTGYTLFKTNPRHDFVIEQRSFVDFFKLVVFMYGHWITVIMIMAAGLGGASLFALGYLILAFWMLWQGNNLYTMNNYGRTIYWWKVIAIYTVLVMFLKSSLQIFGCSLAYTDFVAGFTQSKPITVDFDIGNVNSTTTYSGNSTSTVCIIEQLLSIVCVNSMSQDNIRNYTKDNPKFAGDQCLTVLNDTHVELETKIGFDMLAFIFIILQLRVLHSYFFQRCMIEFRCEMIQAKRGAILINQLIEKEMREQNNHQNKKVEEIKARTKSIRDRYMEQQQRASMGAFIPETYGQAKRQSGMSFSGGRPGSIIDVDDPFPSYDIRYMPPENCMPDETHAAEIDRLSYTSVAKRAGDYYMFDYDPAEADQLGKPMESVVPEVTPGAGDFDKLDPYQLLYTAVSKDLDFEKTLEAVAKAETVKDKEWRMIAAVAKSPQDRERVLKSLRAKADSPEYRKAAEILEELAKSEKDEYGDESDSPATTVRFRKHKSSDSPGKSSDEGQGDPSILESAARPWPELIFFVIKFVWKMLKACMESTAAFLNRRSREHRYVSYVLNKEKEKLKEVMNNELYDAQKSAHELRKQWESFNMHLVSSHQDIRKLEEDAHLRWEQRNVFAKLTTAIANCFAAHTDIMCFFLAIWAHARCAGLITLPLPVLVFFWGSLAVPRPSKIFWIVMIAYTELIICVKFIFQFSFWSWNHGTGQVQGTGDPYRFDFVLGIQQMKFFAVADVALLISLFFHRYMLRKLGLWKDANVEDTFSPSPSTISTTANTEADNQNKSRPSIDTLRSDSNKKAETFNDQVAINMENNGENEAEPRPSTSAAPVESTQPSDNDESRVREKTDEEDDKGSPIAVFFSKLLHPKFRYIRDLYPLMFFLDMFCFAIVAISYSSFGEGSGSGQIISDIQSSRVPTTFVLMLVIIACMIVIDRGLYLRKAVVCKLIYQLFSVIALHIWIFFVLPSITKREAAVNTAARNLYIVKCIYFFVSAWQIRNGYPSLCIGNLLTHSYGLANMVLFKVFMAVPFLFELRTSIDWTWTDTSMPLFDYFNMENFYATIYNLKCARTFEENFPAPKGEPKGKAVKYMMGLPMILILIMTVLLPLLLFGLLNQIGEPAIPEAASLSISIEGFPPLYTMEAQGIDLPRLNGTETSILYDRYSESIADVEKNRRAVAFLNEYKNDGLRALFRPESESFWQVSIETRRALYGQLLKSNETGRPMMYSVHLEFQRPRVEKKEPTKHTIDWSSPIGPQLRLDLMALVDPDNKNNVTAVTFPRALPMYVVVPSEGGVRPAKNLLGVAREKDENDENPKINTTFNDLTLKLEREDDQFHWIVQNMTRNPGIEKFTLDPQKTKYMRPKRLNGYYVDVIAFADRIFPSIIPQYLIQGGLVAMYAGFVLLIGRVIRGLVASGPLDVIINEIPNPDYLLKICLDIYLVREYGDFTLEQDLFAKLIFLFRSPNTLIRWTRYRLQPKIVKQD